MIAIYKRELKSCFSSFIGFLFIAVILFFIGLYFTVYNMISGYPYFSSTVSSVLFMLLICIPILTMKVLSEEKKQKTDQLILTAPISVGDVVMGKFLALETVFAIPTLIVCLYPLILAGYGTIPYAETYIAILAFFLFGSACIAIGLFVSSLAESQVISAVLGFGILFICYMMPGICSIISTTGNAVTRVLGCLDIYTPFAELTKGTLNLGSIIYFLSLIAFVLFLTVQSIQKRRYTTSVKNFSIGAYSSGMIIVMLVAVLVLNLAVDLLPESVKAVDVTNSKMYSLTKTTKNYLDNLDQDVQIYMLANEDSADTVVKQTLQRYDDYSDHITVEYVDPAVNPTFYTQFTTGVASSGSIIVVSDLRSKIIYPEDLYQQEETTTADGYAYETISGYDGEGQITSAIDYVLNENISKVYVVRGHNEVSLGSRFTDRLDKSNIDDSNLILMEHEEVPEDATMLFINSPESDFSKEDAQKVIDYLDQGGRVIAVVGYNYTEAGMPNFTSILNHMGISMVEGMIVETKSDYHYYGSQYMLYPEMDNNNYTADVYGTYYNVMAPYAMGMEVNTEDNSMTYTTILNTSSEAFSRLEMGSSETDLKMAEGEEKGPFKIGVEAVKTLEDGEATMVVYTSSWIFADLIDQQVSGANSQLFINTIGNLCDTFDSDISVPVKEYELSFITMTGGSIILVAFGVIIVLPVTLLIVGFVVWFRRRKR